VVDTAGAALSREAEEGGLAGENRSVASLNSPPCGHPRSACFWARVPAGERSRCCLPTGCSARSTGGFSPLPPEGASAIRYGDTSHAAEMAASQGVRGTDLLRHGIVDRVIAELPDAADEAEAFIRRVGRVLEQELSTLVRRPVDELVPARLARYRALGIT